MGCQDSAVVEQAPHMQRLCPCHRRPGLESRVVVIYCVSFPPLFPPFVSVTILKA